MNLRTVRKKIKSVKNVKKITKAMQLVSAVKMKKAQQAEIEGRPYQEGLTELIQKIVSKIDPTLSQLLQVNNEQAQNDLIILVTSNKGLAGSFNVNIFRYLFKNNIDFKKTDFITLGNKGAQFVGRMGSHILADYSRGNALIEVSAVFSFALEKFLKGEYKSISVVYNKFISTLRSETVQEVLLPMNPLSFPTPIGNPVEGKHAVNHGYNVPDQVRDDSASNTEYLIEPSPQEIIDQLLRSYIEEKIRGAVISSEAVEHSMRMMAMKTATDNAGDVIYSLTLVGNKLRQTKITNELLDMVTAKESVEGD